ncbi:MAG TPA: hypothetical protein V6C69_07000 [Trichormus sp.]|jgi:hypothetical protein
MSESQLTHCLVCECEIEEHVEVKFGSKPLTVCSNECAGKFKKNPAKYIKSLLISIIMGLTVNPAIAASADEAYQIIATERTHLMSQYDATAREADDLQRRIAALKHDSSREAGRAEDELDRELSDKNRELKELEFQIHDLDQALKPV